MIIEYNKIVPIIDESAFIASNATIIGRCKIGKSSSVWFNSVVRADENDIIIGDNTNIQDGCVLHNSNEHILVIGSNVTVGHNVTLHGCKIGDNCLIGMGSTVLDGAIIGKNVIIGANSLITSGKSIPDNSLAIGSPAKVIRQLTEEEVNTIKESSVDYVKKALNYKFSQG